MVGQVVRTLRRGRVVSDFQRIGDIIVRVGGGGREIAALAKLDEALELQNHFFLELREVFFT